MKQECSALELLTDLCAIRQNNIYIMTHKELKIFYRMIEYDKIHEFHDVEHKSIRWIADCLGLNFRTVRKYLGMSRDEFEEFSGRMIRRPFILEPYKGFIVSRLQQFPDTSAALMYTWLTEHYPDFPDVKYRTVYNYVMKLRMDYGIPKMTMKERRYAAVPETPPGECAQVDFGHKKLRSGDDSWHSVHFMVMVLCQSRYKFVWFQDRPFTSETAVQAHEKAFEYFHGIPRKIIYDQDAVFLREENRGDYKMTAVFDSYVRSRPFRAVFCRPADPESKGKVENCVKYVKNNFLHNRTYVDLDTLQVEGEAWLNRIGNRMPHGTTLRIPYDEWCEECRSLQPYTPVGGGRPEVGHKVNKDNSVKYRGNIYSVPLGAYRDEHTRVLLRECDGELTVSTLDGREITRHMIPEGRGNKVINRSHYRKTSDKVQVLFERTAALFSDRTSAEAFLGRIRDRYPRYLRDQLSVICECVARHGQKAADEALEKCHGLRLCSANDFKSIISESAVPEAESVPEIRPLGDDAARMMANFQPGRSSINTYEGVWNR